MMPKGPFAEWSANRDGFLTRGQEECLYLAAQGLSNAAIAKTVGLNVKAVEKRLQAVYHLLDVAKKTALIPRVAAIYWYMWFKPELVPTEEPYF